MSFSLFDYIERIAQVVPEALNTWRAQSPDGFCHISEQLLGAAITTLEAQAKNLNDPQIREDTITAAALGFFNRFGVRASSQTNSRGHVDIYIQHSSRSWLVICGEAKIWKGSDYHIKGLSQVLGYSTGRMPFCFVLAYVKTGQIEGDFLRLKTALNEIRPEQQQEDCRDHDHLRWALVTNHQHASGRIVTALHAGVNLVCP
jgi:hypothetical protein